MQASTCGNTMGAETESPVTRRELFGLLESADPAPSSDSRPTVEPKDNPITKYPKPPFKKQSQPWPVSPAKWSRGRTTAKRAIAARAACSGEKRSLRAATPEWVVPPPSPSRVKAPTWRSTIFRTRRPTQVIALIEAEGRIGLAAAANPDKPPPRRRELPGIGSDSQLK
jgi:hypothetical protein